MFVSMYTFKYLYTIKLKYNTMKVKDYNKYRRFEYVNNITDKDDYQLGDVVCLVSDGLPEIGVILQVHSPNEFRTDMWGNCSSSEIKMADLYQISKLRPELFEDIIIMSWKEVFNSSLKDTLWGHIDNVNKVARESGYKFFSWNGWIHRVDGEILPIKVENCL